MAGYRWISAGDCIKTAGMHGISLIHVIISLIHVKYLIHAISLIHMTIPQKGMCPHGPFTNVKRNFLFLQ